MSDQPAAGAFKTVLSRTAWADSMRGFVQADGLLGWLLFGLSAILVIIALVSPPATQARLHDHLWLFGQSLEFLEAKSTRLDLIRLDLIHLSMFGWLGFLLTWLLRGSPLWFIAMPLASLAVSTELLQFLVPGRTPLISDLYSNLMGLMIGMVLATPLTRVARWKT